MRGRLHEPAYTTFKSYLTYKFVPAGIIFTFTNIWINKFISKTTIEA